MAIALQIAVTGDEKVERRLSRLANRSRDARPVMREIAKMVEDANVDRLGRGRGGLKRLDPDTLARKRREGIDERPLRGQTGRLLESVTRTGAPGNITDIDRTSMYFGTSVPYAKYHDRGIGVPRRRVIFITTKQRQPISNEILDWLMGQGRWVA